MRSKCDLSEQELLMHGVILREALMRILVRHAASCGVGVKATEVCIRSLGNARLDIGLGPFSGGPLPSTLESTVTQALSNAPRTKPDFKILLSAIEMLLPGSRWIKRLAAKKDDADFEERHRHALIFGKGGLFQCSTITLGLAVMEPELNYPFHKHPPAEFYLVLSEGDWYREDAGWWSPGAGGVVFNPPSAVHSMRSTSKPLLALWGLIENAQEAVPDSKGVFQ